MKILYFDSYITKSKLQTILFYLQQVRTARNAIMHTSTFKVTDPDLQLYSKSMINLLNDVNISASPRAQNAVTQIQKVSIASDFILRLQIVPRK